MDALRQWIEQHSQKELADRLDITQGAVSQWLLKGRLPMNRVRQIERITGIPAAELHPDFRDNGKHRRAAV